MEPSHRGSQAQFESSSHTRLLSLLLHLLLKRIFQHCDGRLGPPSELEEKVCDCVLEKIRDGSLVSAQLPPLKDSLQLSEFVQLQLDLHFLRGHQTKNLAILRSP